MSKKKKSQSQSIKTEGSLNSAIPNTPLSKVTTLPKWYQSINSLPLNRFIDIIVDENILALVISGRPTDEQLNKAWEDISLQYADAIKDNEYKLVTSLQKEINTLTITYNLIQEAIKTLKDFYTKQFAVELNALLKSSFKFDIRFPDDYDNDLKRAKGRSKGILLQLQIKQSAYDAIATKRNSGGKATREYFSGILITLSDYVKYRIGEDITVFEFCDRIRRVNQYYESQKLKKA